MGSKAILFFPPSFVVLILKRIVGFIFYKLCLNLIKVGNFGRSLKLKPLKSGGGLKQAKARNGIALKT